MLLAHFVRLQLPLISSVRAPMFAWFKLVSFHVAVSICVALGVLVAGALSLSSAASSYQFSTASLLVGVVCVSAIAVVGISVVSHAYQPDRWVGEVADGASVVLLVGHLGPIVAVAMLRSMVQAGAGSGLALVFPILWALLFYVPGVLWALNRLSRVADARKAP